jgi:hypothetical protein
MRQNNALLYRLNGLIWPERWSQSYQSQYIHTRISNTFCENNRNGGKIHYNEMSGKNRNDKIVQYCPHLFYVVQQLRFLWMICLVWADSLRARGRFEEQLKKKKVLECA